MPAWKQLMKNQIKLPWVVFVLVQFWVIYHWHRHLAMCADDFSGQHPSIAASASGISKPIRTQRQRALQPLVNYNVDGATVARLERPFARWNQTFPCFPSEENWDSILQLRRPTNRGFLYFKARKAGSSTVAGVALRIAKHVAQRQRIDTPHCHTRYGHPPAHLLNYYKRDKTQSFLWSIIREPTKRHISEFFHFAVSRWKLEPSDINFQQYFAFTKEIQNYYLQFMSTEHRFKVEGATDEVYTNAVAKIMDEYNFIGITERMHESLVCLQMMLNLSTSDILYISAKQNGGFDDGLAGGKCFYIVPTYISPGIKEFIEQSEAWQQYTKGDNLLYLVVNRSLDLTIDALGRDEFYKKLLLYRNSLRVSQKTCGNVTFPCSPGGTLNTKHDCYLWDSGCGFTCLDQVAKEMGVDS